MKEEAVNFIEGILSIHFYMDKQLILVDLGLVTEVPLNVLPDVNTTSFQR